MKPLTILMSVLRKIMLKFLDIKLKEKYED